MTRSQSRLTRMQTSGRNRRSSKATIIYPVLSDERDFIAVDRCVNPDGYPTPQTVVIARVYRRGHFMFRSWKTVSRHPTARAFSVDLCDGREAVQSAVDQTAADYEAVARAWQLHAAITALRPG
jgi:hypothetical protein